MSETVLRNDLLDVTRYTWYDLQLGRDRARYQVTDRFTGKIIMLSAEQWEGLRAALGAEHHGIELRISNLSGELTRATSDQLHASAKYSGHDDEWQELLPGVAWPDDTPLPARLKIEIRPVTLGSADADAAEGALMLPPPAFADHTIMFDDRVIEAVTAVRAVTRVTHGQVLEIASLSYHASRDGCQYQAV